MLSKAVRLMTFVVHPVSTVIVGDDGVSGNKLSEAAQDQLNKRSALESAACGVDVSSLDCVESTLGMAKRCVISEVTCHSV